MIIDTKFDIGDKVFAMDNNKIQEFIVASIRGNLNQKEDKLNFGLHKEGYTNRKYKKIDEVYTSIDDLLTNMKKNHDNS